MTTLKPHDPRTWTRELIDRHSLDLRQFIDFRPSTLPNGMRIIEAYNPSGLSFTLLPDRGMDIWTAHYQGIPLTWISPGSPHPPDYGQSWLRQFNGGLLTTCGLTHVGPPEVDDLTGEQRDIHGNYTRLRAQINAIESDDALNQTLIATVNESALFGPQLEVRRTITHGIQPEIRLTDVITNRGDQPVPLMLLYHLNLGFPLIHAGARLHTPHAAVYPRDAAAAASYATWHTYAAASAEYPEQVFFHHLRGTGPESTQTAVLLTGASDDFGLLLAWDAGTLPYLTQWKNTRQGIYVCGIEPGNCIPEGQNAARNNGRLPMLAPGETLATSWRLAVLDGSDAVQQGKAQLATIAGEPVSGCRLGDYA